MIAVSVLTLLIIVGETFGKPRLVGLAGSRLARLQTDCKKNVSMESGADQLDYMLHMYKCVSKCGTQSNVFVS